MSSTLDESTGSTSPRLALAISVAFIASIVTLPLVQLASELPALPHTSPTAWRLIPQISRPVVTAANSTTTPYQRVMAANQQLCDIFRKYELEVTESAWPIDQPRAWLQAAITGPLRSGNEQVVVGTNGWLFFRPDVDGLTGPGFLQSQVARPGLSGTARQTNPLPAIRRFAADLHERGIQLILLPVPSKGAVLGETASGYAVTPPIHNASFPTFLNELAQSHIACWDPTERLFGAPHKLSRTSRHYLKSDSHWTPDGMWMTAQFVAQRIRKINQPRRPSQRRYETARLTVENVGDIARLLGKDAAARITQPERIEITQVKNLDQSPWKPDPNAEILLLGDSFSNIYSQGELGWDTSAGLAEHLSLALNQPVDRIALNAGGAVAARRELIRQSQSGGRDPLAGKKFVIWQFAERELALGDWQVLPLAKTPTTPKPAPAASPTSPSTITIEGVIVQAGQLPNPASLPYREALIPLHLRSTQGTGPGKIPEEIVVYVWGMQNRRLTPMAAWTKGQRVHLQLVPWSAAEQEFGRFARAELDDPNFTLIDLPTFWGTQ